MLTPIAVEVSAELAARLGSFAADVVPRLRERLFAELGLPLPAVRLRGGSAAPAYRRAARSSSG